MDHPDCPGVIAQLGTARCERVSHPRFCLFRTIARLLDRATILASALAIAVVCALADPAAAVASAQALQVGMGIVIDGTVCSLGFFGYNARHDRLAVTAGHCSGAVGPVTAAHGGAKLGRVVSYITDADSASVVRARGFTLIALSRRWPIEPFFHGGRSAQGGDRVTKIGDRSRSTSGRIIEVRDADPGRPDLGLLVGDVVQLHGDSGCPWFTDDRMLVGMGASGSQDTAGGRAGTSQAQPIGDVIELIRHEPYGWGQDFNVWIE